MPKDRKPLGRGKNLKEALASIRKESDLRIASLGEYDLDVEAISTGNILLDAVTGVGGLPKGRLIELYGLPSSGKSTTALQTAATAQAMGLNILYLDYEHALDPIYCRSLGIDPEAESFLLSQPESFEQGTNAMRRLIETGEIHLCIVDSVAAMVIEKELAIETGASTFADKAKLMAQSMRQLTPIVAKNNVVCVFLNHIQDKIDASPMGQKLAASGVKRTTTPGGVALKFHASLRMEFKPVGNIRAKHLNPLTNEEEDIVAQTKVQVTVTKNKVAPPFKKAEVRVRFGRGFSQAYSVMSVLVSYGVFKKKTGGVYEIDPSVRRKEEEESIRGEENFVTELEKDSVWLEKLTGVANDLLEEHGVEEASREEEESQKVEEEELDELLGAK